MVVVIILTVYFIITANYGFAQDVSEMESNFLSAVTAGNFGVVESLIEQGVNVNIKNKNGTSALLLAIENGYENIAKSLIRKADVNALVYRPIGRWRSRPLHLATQHGQKEIVESLIQNRADVNAMDEYHTPLHIAAKSGLKMLKCHEEVAELLIQNGANSNAWNTFGNTPLHESAIHGHEKVAELLIKNGSDVNVRGRLQNTPIMFAATNGNEKVADLLIRSGSDINVRNELNYTLLHLVAFKGHEKVAKLLIRNGMDINAVDNFKSTPLHAAASQDTNGHQMIIQLLVQRYANAYAKNKKGETPIDVAQAKGFTKIVDVLKEARIAKNACAVYKLIVPKGGNLNLLASRILNGEAAEPGEFPWMAALGYLNESLKISYDCGGTIISEYFILTAAHCLLQRLPVVIRLGKVSLTEEDETKTEIRQYKEIIKHPNYSGFQKKNDIALIRLTERIHFTDRIKPACLQTDLNDENPDVKLVVTGWGVISKQTREKSDFLLKANLITMPLSECNSTLLNYTKTVSDVKAFRNGINEGQYCAYDPNEKDRSDSCQGDSGGPLQIISSNSSLAKVVGVVSIGIGCGTALPSIYTRVAHFIAWIESHVWPNDEIAKLAAPIFDSAKQIHLFKA